MITIIVGTNRTDSTSKQVALYYQSLLEEKNMASHIVDLAQLPQDFAFSALYHNAGKNEAFNVYRELIEKAQKFVFIVPEYNGSFPGVLKTFLDGLKFPESFMYKKAALVGVSGGVQGGALALSHLSDILAYLNMNLVGLRVKLIRVHENMQEGKITNEFYNGLLQDQIHQLINL